MDLKAVLLIIKDAGKINAVALAHKLKQQGAAPVKTAQWVALGVKASSSKGGTVYRYALTLPPICRQSANENALW